MFRMYGTTEARRTLDPKYMTGYLKQAQWAEHIELKKIVAELFERKGSPIDIDDIGIGEARVPINLAEIDEIRDCIGKYHGIDIDDVVLRTARRNVRKHNLQDKVIVEKFDARNLSQFLSFPPRYDGVFCTYFTPGDFPYDSYKFTAKKQHVDYLEIKNAFQRVFRPAYDLIQPSGKLILGSLYKNNEPTAAKQREFYKKCGMTVISKPTDPFTATKEGFWSLRFSEERIMDYLDFVQPEKIELRDLDTYDFAQMVIVSKD